MPRGVHVNSLANLKRGAAASQKKPRTPRWNNTAEFAAKMAARRRELAEARRLERERLAALPVESVEHVEPVINVERVNDAGAVTERREDFKSTPLERRTVSEYDEYSMVRHGSLRRRVVGRSGPANPFLRRNTVARHPVVPVVLGHGPGRRYAYWQPQLDVILEEDQLDRIVTPETGPSEGERRSELYHRDYALVMSGKPLPTSPADNFPRIVRGLHLEKL